MLIAIIFGQCDKATKAEIALGANYNTDRQAGRLINFLHRIVCFGSDDGGLSYRPYKQVGVVKSMNNYSNNKPHDPLYFKEQVKIKYDALTAVSGKFLNGTAVMMGLLGKAPPPIDWAGYCALTPPEQLVWEQRGDELN